MLAIYIYIYIYIYKVYRLREGVKYHESHILIVLNLFASNILKHQSFTYAGNGPNEISSYLKSYGLFMLLYTGPI